MFLVYSIAFSVDGEYIIGGTNDKIIYVIEIQN